MNICILCTAAASSSLHPQTFPVPVLEAIKVNVYRLRGKNDRPFSLSCENVSTGYFVYAL